MKLLIVTALIAAGYANYDINFGVVRIGTPDWREILLAAIVTLVPCLPFIAALVRRMTMLRLPARPSITLAVMLALPGLSMTAVIALMSANGQLLLLYHGFSITACIVSALLLLGGSIRIGRATVIILAWPFLGAIWSLASLGAIAWSSDRISDGRPYCLASSPAREPVGALAYLRGAQFYTHAEWYFHGVLVVEGQAGPVAYNWSPRRLRFDPVTQPDLLSPDPRDLCAPKLNFLASLPLFHPDKGHTHGT